MEWVVQAHVSATRSTTPHARFIAPLPSVCGPHPPRGAPWEYGGVMPGGTAAMSGLTLRCALGAELRGLFALHLGRLLGQIVKEEGKRADGRGGERQGERVGGEGGEGGAGEDSIVVTLGDFLGRMHCSREEVLLAICTQRGECNTYSDTEHTFPSFAHNALMLYLLQPTNPRLQPSSSSRLKS